jgi:hypothetical protein
MRIPLAVGLLLGAAVLSIAAGSFPAARAQTPDSEKINQLFKEIRQHAIAAEYDAELLESYTRSNVSWRSHANRIQEMKSHVNDLGRDFREVRSLQAEGSEWQKEAIDEIAPVLQGMAGHLSSTINHLTQNQNKTQMPAWVDYVKGNRDYANKAANLIRDYVDYGETKARSEALEKKLEVPVAPGQE